MRLKNQYVNADTNKISATAIKPVEHLLDWGHILRLDFYNSPELAQILKYKAQPV
jgi:hypothetical protein